jgi:hypothetical protein
LGTAATGGDAAPNGTEWPSPMTARAVRNSDTPLILALASPTGRVQTTVETRFAGGRVILIEDRRGHGIAEHTAPVPVLRLVFTKLGSR